jgi:hypothetical protein
VHNVQAESEEVQVREALVVGEMEALHTVQTNALKADRTFWEHRVTEARDTHERDMADIEGKYIQLLRKSEERIPEGLLLGRKNRKGARALKEVEEADAVVRILQDHIKRWEDGLERTRKGSPVIAAILARKEVAAQNQAGKQLDALRKHVEQAHRMQMHQSNEEIRHLQGEIRRQSLGRSAFN